MLNRGRLVFEPSTSVFGTPAILIPRLDKTYPTGFGKDLPNTFAAIADVDRDGGIDVVVSTIIHGLVLFRNMAGNRGSWLCVSLRGVHSNTPGIGASITVAGSPALTVRRDIVSVASTPQDYARETCFGLGDAPHASEAIVFWPRQSVLRSACERFLLRCRRFEGRGCRYPIRKKSANKCRWQRRRDRPRPSRPLRVRRWQAAIALLSALAQSHDPPHSSSNRIFAPRCQPHGTPLTCCTDMLPHTPTPTNTPLGDGTSLNWMPLRAASA